MKLVGGERFGLTPHFTQSCILHKLPAENRARANSEQLVRSTLGIRGISRRPVLADAALSLRLGRFENICTLRKAIVGG